MNSKGFYTSILVTLTCMTLIEVILMINIVVKAFCSMISRFYVKSNINSISKNISDVSIQESKQSSNMNSGRVGSKQITRQFWVDVWLCCSMSICVD